MILCPLQNEAAMLTQKRPVITQKFGERPEYYKKYGMNGHNGTDLRAQSALPIFAPFDGEVQVVDSGNLGYGLHIVIRSRDKELEITLGHLSQVNVRTGDQVNTGDHLGHTGNTGDSSAPHLHVTLRRIENHAQLQVFALPVKDANNGFKGAIDPAPYMITWKGTVLSDTI